MCGGDGSPGALVAEGRVCGQERFGRQSVGGRSGPTGLARSLLPRSFAGAGRQVGGFVSAAVPDRYQPSTNGSMARYIRDTVDWGYRTELPTPVWGRFCRNTTSVRTNRRYNPSIGRRPRPLGARGRGVSG